VYSTQVFDLQADIKSRVLFLENRLRELSEFALAPATRARVDAETELIEHILDYYRAVCELEFAFDNFRSTHRCQQLSQMFDSKEIPGQHGQRRRSFR
jgi:hypothetical protein